MTVQVAPFVAERQGRSTAPARIHHTDSRCSETVAVERVIVQEPEYDRRWIEVSAPGAVLLTPAEAAELADRLLRLACPGLPAGGC